jgi:hypothetical protein
MNVRYAIVRVSIGTATLCTFAAGCASNTPQPEPNQATSIASSVPNATPTTGKSDVTTAPSAPSPHAADGSNLAACKDGRCEVLVDGPTTISIGTRLDVDSLRVESIKQDTVKVTVTASNYYSITTDGDSSRIITAMGPTPGVTGPAGTVLTVNRLRVEVVTVVDGAAVLRLTPAR